MPGWHEVTKGPEAAGRVRVLGIIQEQHPDRARLFMQWKQMGWPILVDSLNLLGVEVVPITLGIDEHGVVRERFGRADADRLERFLETEYPASDAPPERPAQAHHLERPSSDAEPDAWRDYADSLILWAGETRHDDAITAYETSRENRDDPATDFRAGVAYRLRFDAGGSPRDFSSAVAMWGRALDANPNQYIWRRRIQQYGPRLDKPYPFYDWVARARDEVVARGDTPAAIRVEPGGAEIARPSDAFTARATGLTAPDTDGRVYRDPGEMVSIEATVVPPAIPPGGVARVHLIMRPNTDALAHWNNEAEDLVFWPEPSAGWRVEDRVLSVGRPPAAVSQEDRVIEFEIRAPARTRPGRHPFAGYALYYVCEDVNGACLYRRQDVIVPITIRD